MEQARKLPIGIQSFEKLRRGGYVYVDKTAKIYEITSLSIPYFFSRPRRFGKSLLLSTFEAYFQGKKELFEGLAIAGLETEWEKYPVLHLDLNAEKFESVEFLEAILSRHLKKWEDTWGGDAYNQTLSGRFAGVILRAYEQTGKEVVVLIDEYDKPMLSNVLDEKLTNDFRRTLKAFYSVLKSSDRYLRFVFLTGVTKFAQVSVFSDLNQLVDISLKPGYASLCGISKDELLQVFTPELKSLAEKQNMTFEEAVEKMTRQYDGYHFAPGSVGMFNPFSVLNALNFGDFDSYWFQTGTPTYLVDLLKDSNYNIRLLAEGIELKPAAFMEYRVDVKNPIPMIYQSGYMTIKNYDKKLGLYTLGFPNDEVRYGFMEFLTPYYTAVTDDETGFHIAKFYHELESGETESFMERLKVFFAKIPYELSNDNERHYQAIFYIVFTLIGQYAEAEVRSATGRADAVVKTTDRIYVFEFKLDGSAEDALKQIDDKGYLLPYRLDGRKLVKVGVDFSKEKRNINRFIVG
ncbi:MAG: ATP-binding protein [Dysgonamonadaceae bacterium]|nr:ATP-binding protein [Dysgonamonadaceae bacterium]